MRRFRPVLVVTLLLLAVLVPRRSAVRADHAVERTFENPTPATADAFGWAVAPNGPNLFVGVPYKDTLAEDAGVVHAINAANGNVIRTFTDPTGVFSDHFGYAVAPLATPLGAKLLVGAPGDSVAAYTSGAVYLFNASSGALTWTFRGLGVADRLGTAVAASGSNVLVGSPGGDEGGFNAGTAYLLDGATGALLKTCPNPNPAVGDQFGAAVAAVGTLLIIGSPEDDTAATNAGRVYVFDAAAPGSSCPLVRELAKPGPAVAQGKFGFSLAAVGADVLVGAPYADTAAADQGAAYLFDPASGALRVTVRNPRPAAFDRFGWSVAGVGSNLLVGAPGDDTGAAQAGAAYLFDGPSGTLLESIDNPRPAADANFGHAVSAVGPKPLVGAPYHDGGLGDQGAAYLVATSCGNGAITAGEACDDGNTVDGDCCSSACQLEPNGSACTDTNLCTVGSVCQGGICGTCEQGTQCTGPCGESFVCQQNGPQCICDAVTTTSSSSTTTTSSTSTSIASSPHVNSVLPALGIVGVPITLSGTGFGASQGAGQVWLGTQPGVLVSWSDTEVVATVAAGSTSGVAKVSQGGVWSNEVSFAVIEAKLVPETMSLVVGETRTVQVANAATGAIVPGVPLVVTPPTVASISPDDPPKLTAVAPGAALISAGEATATLTVFPGPVLPTGTVRWTAPSDGSGFVDTVHAVPTDNPDAKADVFTLQGSGAIQALTSDGTLVWTSSVPATVTRLVPDAKGGVLAVSGPTNSITRLDPATGGASWGYSSESLDTSNIAIRPDGTIVSVTFELAEPFTATVVGVDATTGATSFSVPVENSTYLSSGGCESPGGYSETRSQLSPLVVTANGTTYAAYVVEHLTSGGDCLNGGSTTVRALKLLSIGAGGGSGATTLHSWTGTSSYEWKPLEGVYYTTDSPAAGAGIETVIAPAGDSITMTWSVGTPEYVPWCHGPSLCGDLVPASPIEHNLTVANGGGVSETLIEGPLFRITGSPVAGQNGVLFAPIVNVADSSPALAAISSSGTILWTEQGEFEPIVATRAGGVIARELGETEQVRVFGDANAPSYASLGTGAQYSWLADWFTLVGGRPVSIAADVVDVAETAWPVAGGNPSRTKTGANVLTRVVRDYIALTADAYATTGSEEWAYTLYGGQPTCNFFVHDVVVQAGATAPPHDAWSGSRLALFLIREADSPAWPALAGEWADPHKRLRCWDYLPEGPDGVARGDVIAQKHGAAEGTSGHVGIVVNPYPFPKTASASYELTPQGKIARNDWGFREGSDPNADGAKIAAVVKRYVCY